MLNLVTVPNPILKKKAKAVEKVDTEITRIVEEMIFTLENNPRRGIGLAAPQVGLSVRVIIVKSARNSDNSITYALINPEIVSKSFETELEYEGCLSIPDTYGQVERAKKVVVKALNKAGKKITIKAADLFARVLQHEIDHLDGILMTEKIVGKPITEAQYNKMFEQSPAA
jgi:peptide deformylase